MLLPGAILPKLEILPAMLPVPPKVPTLSMVTAPMTSLRTVYEKFRRAGAGDRRCACVIARTIQLDDGAILYSEPADSGDGVVDDGRSAAGGLSLNRQHAAE